MVKVLTCITHEHDLRLLVLSALICVLGCFTVTLLLTRVTRPKGNSSLKGVAAAGGIFGCSVWSLHFVAMLAYLPDVPITFDAPLTFASIAVAACGATASFAAWRMLPPPFNWALGGLGIGLSVTGMHYIGVAAMRVSGVHWFDETFVAASVIISLVFGVVALLRAGDLSLIRQRVEVTVWLTLTICGLHFVGMTALSVVPGPVQAGIAEIGSTALAVLVGSTSLIILIACLLAVLMQQHLSQRTVQELGRMRLLSDLSREALILHRDGLVVEINSAGTRLFGAQAQALKGRRFMDLFAPDSVPALLRRERCPPDERRPEEFDLVTAAGNLVPVEFSCRVIDLFGKPATAVALRDLSDRKRGEERIRHLALHDALTGLPNRYALNDRLKLALDFANEQECSVAILYLDLDRFKPINDLLGHAAGDQVLVETARRLKAEISSADTLARVGGDEFVIVIANANSPERASLIVSRIVAALHRPFVAEGKPVEIGVSVGVSMYPSDGADPEALLRAADTAMYQAKDDRRGSFRFFETSMNERLQMRRELEQELKDAIARNELELFYQPIVNGRTGETETFEALIRWKHPDRGLISPAEFIPIAEQSDLIDKIGEWVIETACAAATKWSRPWRVSVNVSPSQFRRSDVPALVADALKRHKLPPSRLVVEITEAVFINDTAQAVDTLSKLRAVGIRLALDDFGTGYSSLSYLQLFKFDKFKIDQSFVRRLGQGPEALTIIRTIITLGHNLGLQVTVEGVETREQAALLQGLRCDQMQGYLFGRPAPLTLRGEPALCEGPLMLAEDSAAA